MFNIQMSSIKSSFTTILEDGTIPKNMKLKIDNVLGILNSESEITLKINKVLNELEEISNDTNISPHLRTQMWNLISSLEGVLRLI